MTTFRPLRAVLAALIVVATLFAVDAGEARAQSMGAGATVLVAPTSGAGVRPIAFGTVPLGSTTSRTIGAAVDSTAAGIGHFSFTGVNGNRDVQLTFDFPNVLTRAAGGGTMPITFNGGFGLHCFDRQSGIHGCTLFNPSPGGADPSVIVITPPAPPRNGILRVYLGGSVSPATTVLPGNYHGTVTLTLVRL